jgi:uncharacterized protein (TIGR03435 family)
MKNRNVARLALSVLFVPGIPVAPGVRAQVKSSLPKFEVASVKPGCGGSAPPDTKSVSGGGRQTKGGVAVTSPGRLNECRSLADLIHMAYVMYADAQFHPVWGPQFAAGPPLEGGPAWVRTDQYQIIAKPGGVASREMMSGPMLQALLEDRFRLKIRRENRDIPVYALTVAKGGPKLQASPEGSCVPLPARQPGDPAVTLPPGQKFCKVMMGARKGPNTIMDAQATTLDEFSKLLVHLIDRPVIDKTGITGRFDIHLEFAIDESTPRFLPGGDLANVPAAPSDDPVGPAVFAAIQQQLGLKLEPTKGPGEFLVIDRVERPSAN